VLTNRFVCIIEEGFDVAVRVAVGPSPDSTLVARKVGSLAAWLYASAAYVARRGEPTSIDELSRPSRRSPRCASC
jgi:DNA-binding transcriptional LysR family regulator